MEHYYSNKPTSEMTEETATAVFRDRKFVFRTSSGVFSKKFVDFGSTLLVNTFLESNPLGKMDILDMGCGYGPIGIVVASFFKDSRVDMADVNERAVDLARNNAALNKVENTEIFVSDAFESITGEYDVILTNPPIRAGKKVVFSIFEGAFDRLRTGGVFYCVIQKKQGAESAFRKLEELFGNCELAARKSGYHILKSKRI